jgi:hypothetical protein
MGCFFTVEISWWGGLFYFHRTVLSGFSAEETIIVGTKPKHRDTRSPYLCERRASFLWGSFPSMWRFPMINHGGRPGGKFFNLLILWILLKSIHVDRNAAIHIAVDAW